MNFMSLTAFLPLLIKWGPSIVTLVQTEAPKIHEFIADVEQALAQAQAGTPPAASSKPAATPVQGPNFQWPS